MPRLAKVSFEALAGLLPSITRDLLAPKIARYANNLQVSLIAFGWLPQYVCLDRMQKCSSGKLLVTMLYAIMLLFAWFFDQSAIFSIYIFSSAGYYLSKQVTELSLRQRDSLIALYLFFVFFSVCWASLPFGCI